MLICFHTISINLYAYIYASQVVASGLLSKRSVVLTHKDGNFGTLNELVCI